MRIDILSLFPDMFAPLKLSVLGRAVEKGILQIFTTDIRDYSADKHKKCDDYAFGGGAGMLMTAQPICDAFDSVDPKKEAHHIYMSPKGKKLDFATVKRLASYEKLVILCGHYEGVDERAVELCIDEEISVGDYVLTGGEIPAMLLIDAVCRYVEGVLGSNESTNEESFVDGLLEYPQYTRPAIFRGKKVPEVLLNGDHKKIKEWQLSQSVQLTRQRRPDLAKNNAKIIEYEAQLLERAKKEEKKRQKELKKAEKNKRQVDLDK